MRQRLILHIGDHKAGSTAIQEALCTGEDTIEAFYPMINGVPHHNRLARALRQDQFAKDARRLFKNLARKIRRSRAPCIVLSGEEFEFVRPARVRDMFEQVLPGLVAHMEVVAYVRPHPGRITASYAERIKQGFTTASFGDFLKRQIRLDTFRYAPRLEQQRATWGDQLTLRPMAPTHLRNASVVDDLLAIVDPDISHAPPNPASVNPTLSGRDLAVMRCLQMKLNAILPSSLSFIERESRRAVGWRFARLLAHHAAFAQTPFGPDAGQAKQIREAFTEDAARTDALLSTGTLFVDALEASVATAPDHVPGPERLEAHFPPAICATIEAHADLIAQMFACDPSGWAEQFRRHPLVLDPQVAS